jgi:protein ATS1
VSIPCMDDDAPTLLAAGSNGRGQLATGDSQDAHSFAPCKFARRESSTSPPPSPAIISIVGGGNHTLALLSWVNDSAASLEVWGCGEGAKGLLKDDSG